MGMKMDAHTAVRPVIRPAKSRVRETGTDTTKDGVCSAQRAKQ